MATRTMIFQEQENGGFVGKYIHYDGYTNGVGRILVKHYYDRNKVRKLLDIDQDISSLGTTTDTIPNNYGSNSVKSIMYETWNKLSAVDKKVSDQFYDFMKRYTTILNDSGTSRMFASDLSEVMEYAVITNGYIYYQNLEGKWFVSEKEIDEGEYGVFESVKKLLIQRNELSEKKESEQ